ncbi:RNA polymerase sigma-70 factor (ECF subfamily) [Pseudochelatococcus lubricantis]|uniref:RNA polymerase sigma factor n=1 Tax=Pseudochelatococcus lubricantis TaxID=1538102 RepID=A0ABX0UW06_9HYPH|nr:sigma-70 family RNA polymerase sigma factor [Pseudochelatococcus lubricantis]NIJ57142.1 RNA polymerase sigma-70 factor (ECF subfamily) [Pseudochelatococcus lubricantis]
MTQENAQDHANAGSHTAQPQANGAGNAEAGEANARVRQDLIDAIPKLRAFAISLCGKPERADDLVQETLIRAWAKLSSFTEGTNMVAWLYTILRNVFYSEYRKRRREVEDVDGRIASMQATPPPQIGHMNLRDFREALMKLPNDQREALVLVGGAGLSYEEAAEVCGCALGTIKSRVNRARGRLAQLLTIDSANEIGPDPAWQGVLDHATGPGGGR